MDLNRYSPNDIQITNKHMKWYSTSLVIRGMQSKTTRYHYTSAKVATAGNNDNSKCWWASEDTGTLTHRWWKRKTGLSLCKTVWQLPKKLKIVLSLSPSSSTPRWSQRHIHTKHCTQMSIEALSIIVKKWKRRACLSPDERIHKMWSYIHIVIERNKALIRNKTWMNPNNIMLTEKMYRITWFC